MTDRFFIEQLEKRYNDYLRGLIINEPFVPIILRGGKNKPESTLELHEAVSLFQRHEKRDGNLGWRIEWQNWISKKLGRQQWPLAIYVETEDDYLFLINKEKEAESFKKQLTWLLEWNPSIKQSLYSRPSAVLEYKQDWEGICAVVDYVINNDVSNFYLRSLPVPVHTKFIERHKAIIIYLLKAIAPDKYILGEDNFEKAIGVKAKPFIFPMRWLDMELAGKYTNEMEISGITTDSLKSINWDIKSVWFVENETSLYMLPPMKGVLAICSSGYAVRMLGGISLFENNPVIYWGDLDEDGFIMLHQCRNLYPHAQSAFMDENTVRHHLKEMEKQPGQYKKQTLAGLSDDEAAAYEMLKANNGRIEQEKLQHSYITKDIDIYWPV